MSLTAFFESHHAGELVFDKRVLYEIEETASVEQGLKVMKEKDVRSLPVVRTVGGKKEYTGIISSFDLMSFIAFASYLQYLAEAKTEEEKAKAFEELQISKTPIKDLVGQVSAEGSTVWTFEPTQNLLTVLDGFSKGVHRALVEQKDDHLAQRAFKLLSQTDLIDFIYFYRDRPALKTVLEKPYGFLHIYLLRREGGSPPSLPAGRLDELKFCNPLGRGPQELPLRTISTKDSALEGFRVMQAGDIQAVPVVDAQGAIVTTLSSADSKGVDAHNIAKTLRPAIEFLREIHSGLLLHPITCSAKDSLGSVILKMKSAVIHKHQVWVTDAAQRPIDVVSMTDILQTLLHLANQEQC